jgi:hypothetical protein
MFLAWLQKDVLEHKIQTAMSLINSVIPASMNPENLEGLQTLTSQEMKIENAWVSDVGFLSMGLPMCSLT